MTDQENFRQYSLRDIRFIRNELGRGSYAVVMELEYRGLKCAGKKLHQVLYETGIGHAARRYLEECQLLSQTRHPNIVQFLGVCFEEDSQFPILVMEFLPTNLTSCLERYGVLPNEISYSILYDVSLGLAYLHGQTPAIVHRDLSANNVLLSTNMMAKISDLGVARILNITPLQARQMTGTPGTPAYMPPEVMVANPRYDISVDVFSFGAMIIHTFTAEWPEPKVGPTRIDPANPDRVIGVTEAERREEFLRSMTPEHPLMDLVMRCLNNNPQRRPLAAEIVGRMRGVALEHPPSIENRVQMLQQVSLLLTEKTRLEEEITSRNSIIRQEEEEIAELKINIEEKQEEIENAMQCIELAHSIHTSGLQLQIDKLAKELETTRHVLSTKDALISELQAQFSELMEDTEQQIARVNLSRSQLEAKIAQFRQLEIEKATLGSQVSTLASQIEQEKAQTQTKERALSAKDIMISSMKSTISLKDNCIQRNEEAIRSLESQLQSTRDFLTTKQQALQVNVTHTQCQGAITEMATGQAIVINDRVYYGGGLCEIREHQFYVQCYELMSNIWSLLPKTAVRQFGMGKINGRLVTVGGTTQNSQETSAVYIFTENFEKWTTSVTIPPMSTARSRPAVVSLTTHLIVAGGTSESQTHIRIVEIYDIATSQWSTTQQLPYGCWDIQGTICNNVLYFTGGYTTNCRLNRVLSAKFEDLISHSTFGGDPQHKDKSQNSALVWKEIQSTPSFRSSTAAMGSVVLAAGGTDTHDLLQILPTQKLHAYSPSMNSWVYIGDLPDTNAFSAFVPISQTEFLMIGGRDADWYMHTDVYKVTISLTIQ